MPRPPVLSSAQSPWQGIRVEHFKGGPASLDEEAPLWHHIIVQLDEPSSFEWRDGTRTGRTYIPPWNVGIYPALHPITARNRDTRDFLLVAIEPEFLRRAAHDVSHLEDLQVAFRPINDDPLIRGLALALKTELEAGCPGGRWYGESLATALAVHLVRRYTSTTHHPGTHGTHGNGHAQGQGQGQGNGNGNGNGNGHLPGQGIGPGIPRSPGLLSTAGASQPGGLSRNRLRDAIEYIHGHLAQEIRLDDLARTTELSPYHFARLFKRSTGLAPHQYLIRRRVEHARELLVTSSLPISEIAIQSGFCDQSHLTTHFKRVFGVTPRVFIQDFARRRKPE